MVHVTVVPQRSPASAYEWKELWLGMQPLPLCTHARWSAQPSPKLVRINVRHSAMPISRLVQYIDNMDTATQVVEGWQDDMEAGYAP